MKEVSSICSRLGLGDCSTSIYTVGHKCDIAEDRELHCCERSAQE